jgi:hypothetical protein
LQLCREQRPKDFEVFFRRQGGDDMIFKKQQRGSSVPDPGDDHEPILNVEALSAYTMDGELDVKALPYNMSGTAKPEPKAPYRYISRRDLAPMTEQ